MTAELQSLLQDALGPDYRIEQELAAGGMSRLFLATELRLNRRVVVKVLAPELVTETSTARFKREIEVTVRLQHPHILPVLTSGSFGDVIYYITPFMPGESLRARIARERKLPLAAILVILREVGGALAFAHQESVVHRDVKPGNILLADGHAILADFGIARAVSATATALTRDGLSPGTLPYMAPELPTDEGADVYALGVVAHEMLTGALPKRGATAKDVLAARGVVPHDSSVQLRALAQLVSRTISRAPGGSFTSAQDFCDALAEVPTRRARSRIVAVAALSALFAATAAVLVARTNARPAVIDDGYAVLPLAGGTPQASGQKIAEQLSDAIAEWDGARLADAAVVSSILAKRGAEPLDLDAATAAARSARVGRAIWGTATAARDSIVLRLGVYEAASGRATRSVVRTIPQPGDTGFAQSMRAVANSLLRDGSVAPLRVPSDGRHHSLASWRALDSGLKQLSSWNLPAAEEQLRTAVQLEPQNAPANLWLSQTLIWSNDPKSVEDRRTSARRATEGAAQLSVRDSILAYALLAMTSDDHPAACARFSSLLRSDSADRAAAIGLGDCQRFDSAVIPDARSPSGRRFRSSLQAAVVAYERASQRAPTAGDSRFRGWIINRLAFLPIEVNKVRFGSGVGADTGRFAAHAFLDHDTLAFVPLDLGTLASGKSDPTPNAIADAVTRSREVLRRAAEQWVAHDPQDAAAYEQLAAFAELTSTPTSLGGRQLSAIDAIRSARRLATNADQQRRLAIVHVRLMLKAGEFGAARLLADSLLSAPDAGQATNTLDLAGLAILTGRPARAVPFLRAAPEGATFAIPGGVLSPPQPVGDPALSLRAYASVGAVDSALAIARRVMQLIPRYYPDTAAANTAMSALVRPPVSLVFPSGAALARSLPPASDALSRAQRALFLGDSAAARDAVAARKRVAAQFLPGTVAIDATYRSAVLAFELGDRADAIAQLDRVLGALPTLGVQLLAQAEQVGSLVRAMAFRARLAAQAGDVPGATQWSEAVHALWSGAEPVLASVLDDMAKLSVRRVR